MRKYGKFESKLHVFSIKTIISSNLPKRISVLVRPSRIRHRISKIFFALGADEFLEDISCNAERQN